VRGPHPSDVQAAGGGRPRAEARLEDEGRDEPGRGRDQVRSREPEVRRAECSRHPGAEESESERLEKRGRHRGRRRPRGVPAMRNATAAPSTREHGVKGVTAAAVEARDEVVRHPTISVRKPKSGDERGAR
jgi:hypothetical protein